MTASSYIEHWLQSVDEHRTPHIQPVKFGRKRQAMDTEASTIADTQITPRAPKRQAIGIFTPAGSSADIISVAKPLSHAETPSSKSSRATSSQASSPNKRQRDADIQFSRPVNWPIKLADAELWVQENMESAPIMRELLDNICDDATQSYEANDTKYNDSLGEILKGVSWCTDLDGSEEDWSDRVVLPTLNFAKMLVSTKDRLDIINVKSVDVYPLDLLPLNARTLTVSKKRVDYTIGVQVADGVRNTMQMLGQVANYTLAQSNHKKLRHQALCCHLEIKATSGDFEGATAQLSTWCAAGFRKMERLYLDSHDSAPRQPALKYAPIPMWLWQGTRVSLFIAVLDSDGEGMYLVHRKEFAIDATDTAGLMKLVKALAGIMQWGVSHFLPWFRNLIGRPDLNE